MPHSDLLVGVARIPETGNSLNLESFVVKLVLKRAFKKMSDTHEVIKVQNPEQMFSNLFADGEWMFGKNEHENAVKSLTAVSEWICFSLDYLISILSMRFVSFYLFFLKV